MTTSFNLPSFNLPFELKQQLDDVAETIQRSSSWVVVEALKQYLEKYNRCPALVEEARRQC